MILAIYKIFAFCRAKIFLARCFDFTVCIFLCVNAIGRNEMTDNVYKLLLVGMSHNFFNYFRY